MGRIKKFDMKSYKEFCEEQRKKELNERFSNRGSEAALADMSRILHKPEPDFSCLTITSKELDEWYKEYYRKKSYTLKDDILLMDYGHIDNPHPLKAMKEAYGDRQPLDNIAEEMNLKYHFFEGQIKKVEASNRVSVYVAVPISDLLKADIIRDFHEGGYFCNKERIETDSFGSHYRLQFEPYIQNKDAYGEFIDFLKRIEEKRIDEKNVLDSYYAVKSELEQSKMIVDKFVGYVEAEFYEFPQYLYDKFREYLDYLKKERRAGRVPDGRMRLHINECIKNGEKAFKKISVLKPLEF